MHGDFVRLCHGISRATGIESREAGNQECSYREKITA